MDKVMALRTDGRRALPGDRPAHAPSPEPRLQRRVPGLAHAALRRAATLLVAGAILIALAAGMDPSGVRAQAAGAGPAAAAPVLVVPLQEAIGPATADWVVRAIRHAEERNAALVVLVLDTPGGLDTSMRQIIQAVLQSRVPVATYVSPQGSRAASAGTYILYASHVAAMAPATTLGAATPVSIGLPGPRPGGEAPREVPRGTPAPPQSEAAASAPQAASGASGAASGAASSATAGSAAKGSESGGPALGPADAMTAKQVHDAAAFIRGLAQRHGRNAEWAERAVREAVSLTAEEALRQRVIDVVAADVADLLAQVDGRRVRMAGGEATLATRGAPTAVFEPDWRHRLLTVIANPSFALILLMVGIYGLVFEFSSPGFGVPGTVGAICLLLALFALQLLPTNYAGLALILLGIALMVAELLTPAFGVLGVGGVVAFVAGGILIFDRDVPGLGLPLTLIFGLAASSAVLVLLGGGMALRARRAPVVSGTAEMIGQRGLVTDVSSDGAWARVRGERWAVTCHEPLQVGQAVRVTGVQGLRLQVDAEPSLPGSIGATGGTT